MGCLVFEEDEEVVCWKAASSVAYCVQCFNDKMERQMRRSVGRNNAITSDSQAKEWENNKQGNQSRSTKQENVERYSFINKVKMYCIPFIATLQSSIKMN